MKITIPILCCAAALLLLPAFGDVQAPAPLSAEATAFLPADAAAEFRDLNAIIVRGYEQMMAEAFNEEALSERPAKDQEAARALIGEARAYITILDEYARTGNPNQATPLTRQTPLHFAVMFRKEALVREMLRQGADPNARSALNGTEMDGPLTWAIGFAPLGDVKPDKDSSLRLIDMLVAAGAEVKGDVGGAMLVMLPLLRFEGAEEVYLHLLELGADPRVAFVQPGMEQHLVALQEKGWHRAALRLKEQGIQAQEEESDAFAGGAEETSTPPPAVSERGRAFLEAYFEISHRQDAVFEELATLLAGVVDEASADAAAPAAAICVERINAFYEEMEALSKAQEEPEQLLAAPQDIYWEGYEEDEHPIPSLLTDFWESQYPGPHPQAFERFLEQGARMDEAAYFDSGALREATETLVNSFLEDE